MNRKLFDKAAVLLPKCHCLKDAERVFGGTNDRNRDYEGAAVAWGIYDGYSGRPITPAGLPVDCTEEYLHAAEVGRKISLMEKPG